MQNRHTILVELQFVGEFPRESGTFPDSQVNFPNDSPVRYLFAARFVSWKNHRIAQVQIRALIGRGGETIQEIFRGILGSEHPRGIYWKLKVGIYIYNVYTVYVYVYVYNYIYIYIYTLYI